MNQLKIIHTLIKLPLFHFVMIGLVLYLLFPQPSSNTIIISSDNQRALQRQQGKEGLAGAVANDDAKAVAARVLQDELFYREGLRLGLDQGDHIIRQRVIQKVHFMAEHFQRSLNVTPAELEAFYQTRQSLWMIPQMFDFEHIFVRSHDKDKLSALRKTAIESANSGETLGEPFLSGRRFEQITTQRISDIFGNSFVEPLNTLAINQWSLPVQSKLGWHLVRVSAKTAAEPAPFALVQDKVAAVYTRQQKKEAIRQYVVSLLSRYDVVIEGEDSAALLALTQ